MEGGVEGLGTQRENQQPRSISLHAFCDLSHVAPVVFLYLLKECYACGTRKATLKFRALHQQVYQVLFNGPSPGPATFVAHCLLILPIFEEHCEGFSHLILSALRRLQKRGTVDADVIEAKVLAATLFVDIVQQRAHTEGILIKILEVFDVTMIEVEKVLHDRNLRASSNRETGDVFVENYIFSLIESQSFMAAVSLLERFSIRQSGESFLHKMMDCNDFRAAEKWATFMGKPLLSELVQGYVSRKLLKHAYRVIKKNNLQQDFPEVYHLCKESSLKGLAQKGCWDVAEERTNGDKQLLEYLVYLAMEAGYLEKVEELCDRYSLKGFMNVAELEATHLHSRYLHLDELFIEDIVWVDDANGLCDATSHIEECKVVGVDCEWKPNYLKGSKPNKVAIMQIALESKVYILDLIKLYEDVPDVLDGYLTRIMHSPRILKLGYNFQCDVNQLSQSYGDLQCFKHYDMLLDIQNVFKEHKGGLSALTEEILGVGLNKTRRNSNWEQRPLSHYQLEYAALDAAVLVRIFWHVRGHAQPAGVSDGQPKIEWKSHIVSYVDKTIKTKRGSKSKRRCDSTNDTLSRNIEPDPAWQ